MSLITRCPACGTMFKVVPDQLRISEGWVRCGHCTEVFDAYRQMQAPQSATAPAAAGMEPLPVAGASEAAKAAAAQPASDAAGWRDRADPAAVESPAQAVEVDIDVGMVLDAPQAADPVDYHFLIAPESSAESPPAPALGEPLADAVESVSFLRDGRRKAFWRGRWVRGVLALLLVALLLMLGLQVVVHQRDRLAAAEPRLKPWLQALCAPLQCRLAPLRQIESVVIDSSAFSRVDTETFRLRFTVRNNAALEVATPAFELTLTDAQDQPVLRRVLQAADLGAPPTLASQGEWSASVPIGVDANGSGLRIAGYRLVAFYP